MRTGREALTEFWLRNGAKNRIAVAMIHVPLLKPMRRAALLVAPLALAACSTMNLPDAPKTIGQPVKANPHYKIGAPYEINGEWYVPKTDERYDETGVASWYGDDFHGKLTANGEIFDKRRLSAAHKTLPLPTIAEVENLDNGKRIIVRVNDRGPFRDNRVIDLSHAAADELGFTQKGTTRVRVRYVGETDVKGIAAAPGDSAPLAVRMAATAPVRASADIAQSAATAAEQDSLAALIASSIGGEAPSSTAVFEDIWVELATVENHAALQSMNLGDPGLGPVSVRSNERSGRLLQSVRIGPFFDEAIAAVSLSRAKAAGFGGARIVRDGGE